MTTAEHLGLDPQSIRAASGLQPRWPAPWVFSFLMMPLGVYLGFIWTALPFLLGQAGIPVDRIAGMSALLQLPGMLLFLWTPVVDIKLRRRTWLVLGALGTALCLGTACPLVDASHVRLLTLVLLIGGITGGLVPASCGGIMARMLLSSAQSRASAWNQAGQLGGGALGAAVALWLATRLPLPWVGVVSAALAGLPGLLALAIPEPAPPAAPWFRGRLAKIGHEALDLLRDGERRWSVLLLLAPCCTAAAQGLLPALASHYGVGVTGVTWTNGIGGGVVLALGALCSALIPAAWDRRLTYVSGGLANALTVLLLLSSTRPTAYVVGTLLYLLTTGFCWARFVALALAVIGPNNRDASTWYGVLTAAGTIPVTCMVWLDGVGFHKGGNNGLLWTDAAPNLLVFAVVAVACTLSGFRRRGAV